jgi:hypothetical protein
MLKALVGFWIGTTMLSLDPDGTYLIGGATLIDKYPMHGGDWAVVQESVIEFGPALLKDMRPIYRTLVPQAPLRCRYTLVKSRLELSDCAYEGSFVPFKSARERHHLR